MPWRDGGGVTTEIAIEPAEASVSDAFAWRLSSARVEASGPFSRFPGCLRTLVLLDGAGLVLTVGSRTLLLDAFEWPVHFAGDDDTRATLLQGGCIDLGLIWDPTQVRTRLSTHRLASAPLEIPLAITTLLVAPRGGIRVAPQGVDLGPMDCVRSDGTEQDGAWMVQAARPGDPVPVVVIHLGSLENPAPQS